MAKLIRLTKGQFAIVDDKDFEWLSEITWSLSYANGNYYAKGWDSGKHVQMHRKIFGLTNPNIQIDHKNRNPLDNRRENLRIATRSQNMANKRPSKKGSSQYRGVQWCKDSKKWRVDIVKNKVRKYLGKFESETDAAVAYNMAAIEIHGEFAYINKIDVFPQPSLVELVYGL